MFGGPVLEAHFSLNFAFVRSCGCLVVPPLFFSFSFFFGFRGIMKDTPPRARSLSPDTEDLIEEVLNLGDENLVSYLVGTDRSEELINRQELSLVVRAVAGAVSNTPAPENCHTLYALVCDTCAPHCSFRWCVRTIELCDQLVVRGVCDEGLFRFRGLFGDALLPLLITHEAEGCQQTAAVPYPPHAGYCGCEAIYRVEETFWWIVLRGGVRQYAPEYVQDNINFFNRLFEVWMTSHQNRSLCIASYLRAHMALAIRLCSGTGEVAMTPP